MGERDNGGSGVNGDNLTKIVTTEQGETYRILKFPKSTFDLVIADTEAFFEEIESQRAGKSVETVSADVKKNGNHKK